MKLIDKDALLAEIDKLQLCTMDEHMNYYSAEAQGEYNALSKLESFLDTLEVKEFQKNNLFVVTRCEEHSDYVEKVFFSKEKAKEYCKQFEGNEDAYGRDITEIKVDYPTFEVKEVDLEKEIEAWEDSFKQCPASMEYKETAKYFFELGLQAKHDNWKVVDNANLPQTDRNKIYCVLSKNKYLLARVINHPQDEDLLQWKCTEFPFNRYDMCEGDEYMQIV